MTAENVKQRLRGQGPFIGMLFITSDYYNVVARSDGGWNGCSFPGCPPIRATREARKLVDKDAGLHAVVCDAYRHGHGEALLIRVQDNHSDQGPSRWVDLGAFDNLFIHTDCGAHLRSPA